MDEREKFGIAENKVKICSKCKKEKEICEFYKNKTYKTGITATCKSCINEANKKWRLENKEKYLEAQRAYTKNNKGKKSEYDKEYREKNINRIKEYKKKQWKRYSDEIAKGTRKKPVRNAETSNNYFKERRKNDIEYKLKCTIRGRFRQFLKCRSVSNKIVELTGCTLEELKNYLEGKFKEGMTWENYGGYFNNGWNIDHIIPCSRFDFNDEQQVKKCFHYTNLQPLWWKENLSKGNK